MKSSIPNMKCDHCGKCCGPAACTPQEFRQIGAYARMKRIIPIRQGSTCPWYQRGSCQVYPRRPFICRLFGHTPELRCGNGHNVNLPIRAIHRLSIMLPRPNDYLWIHQCCYSEQELALVLEGYARRIVGNPIAEISVTVPKI